MRVNFVESNPKTKIQKICNNALFQINLEHGISNLAHSIFSSLEEVFWRTSDLISKLQ